MFLSKNEHSGMEEGRGVFDLEDSGIRKNRTTRDPVIRCLREQLKCEAKYFRIIHTDAKKVAD